MAPASRLSLLLWLSLGLWLTLAASTATTNLHDTAAIAFHRREAERLRLQRDTLRARLTQLERRVSLLDDELRRETMEAERLHLRQLQSRPSPRGLERRDWRCIAWRKTYQCRSTGRRFPAKDQPCDALVAGGASGFCELQDVRTGAFVRVMETNCSSRPPTTTHTCAMAPRFADVGVDIERLLTRRPAALASTSARGIVTVVVKDGRRSTFAAAAPATLLLERLQQLRRVGCRLPVEIWAAPSAVDLYALQRDADALDLRPIHVRHLPPSASSSATATATATAQLLTALRLTSFAQVLSLDLSSAVVLQDPTPLFASAAFASHGAVFWPHVHHERTTERNLQRSSWLWELLDLPFVDALETDPRVLLLDRRHAGVAAALELAEFLANEPLLEELVLVPDGSDLLQLAWRRRHIAFAVVETPPSVVGSLLSSSSTSFCGTHVLQHDADGAPWVLLPRLAPPAALGHLPVKRLEALAQLTHVQRYHPNGDSARSSTWHSAASQSGYDVQSVVVDGGSATCLRAAASSPQVFTTEPLSTSVVKTLTSVQGTGRRRQQRHDEEEEDGEEGDENEQALD